MQTTLINQATIQKVYEDAYKEAVNNATPNVVTIGVESGYGHKQEYKERNFYFCGFSNLSFKANTGMNRKLAKLVNTRKAYGGGFTIILDKIGSCGNGDFELQADAFNAVASYLNQMGFTVYAENNLD